MSKTKLLTFPLRPVPTVLPRVNGNHALQFLKWNTVVMPLLLLLLTRPTETLSAVPSKDIQNSISSYWCPRPPPITLAHSTIISCWEYSTTACLWDSASTLAPFTLISIERSAKTKSHSIIALCKPSTGPQLTQTKCCFMSDILLSWGLCAYCFPCMRYSSPEYLHGSVLRSSPTQLSSSQRGFSLTTLFKNEKPQCCLFPSLICLIFLFSMHYLLTCCAVCFFFFTAALQLEHKLLEGRDFSLLCLLIYPWPHNNAWHIAGVSEILAEWMGRRQVFSANFWW